MSDSLAPFRLSIQKDPAPDIRCTVGEGILWPESLVVLLPHVEVAVRWVLPALVGCDGRNA